MNEPISSSLKKNKNIIKTIQGVGTNFIKLINGEIKYLKHLKYPAIDPIIKAKIKDISNEIKVLKNEYPKAEYVDTFSKLAIKEENKRLKDGNIKLSLTQIAII